MKALSADLASVTTIGLDLAKHVFQVHCIDAAGKILLARPLRRAHDCAKIGEAASMATASKHEMLILT